VRRLLASAVLALLAGCGGAQADGFVTMLDSDYRAELIGSPGDGFTAPDGLLWHDGALYMADEGGSAVRVWRPGAGAVTLADARAGFRSPEDLVRDAAGNLYVTDDDAGGVRRIDPRGRTLLLAGGIASTEALAIAPDGTLLVGDQNGRRVLLVAPDGRMRVLIGPEAAIAKPESLAFDGRGNLYIADNQEDVLYLLDADGRLHRPIAGRRGFSPESIVHAGGTLYITDSRHGALYRYTPEDGLAAIAVFGGDLGNVQGVTADPAGNLYLSVQADLDAGRGYVLRLTRRR
jgi:sugar lactone lactonase YvrE